MVKAASAFGGSTFEGEGFREAKGFSAAGTPIYLGLKQELHLYENNEFDVGAIEYLKKRGIKLESPKALEKRAIVSPVSAQRIRLDEILDAQFRHTSPQNIFDEEGFSQYGTNCMGAVPITRGNWYYLRREDFLRDYKKSTADFLADLKEGGNMQAADRSTFAECMDRKGYIKYTEVNGRKVPTTDLAVLNDPRAFGELHSDYFFSSLEKFLPNTNFGNAKKLDLQWFNDRGITALEFDKERNRWKCHGWLQVLEIPGVGKYVCFRDNSSNGSWVIKDGEAKDEIDSLEHLAELDKADETLKVSGKGHVDLVKNFVTEKDGKTYIQMTRTPKRGVSPIYNAILGKLGEKWKAEIRMGTYPPGNSLPQNILEISTY